MRLQFLKRVRFLSRSFRYNEHDKDESRQQSKDAACWDIRLNSIALLHGERIGEMGWGRQSNLPLREISALTRESQKKSCALPISVR
jgi:hypothetical protein